ncbi:MAG: V-type ATP synthase subunit E family protein [Hespellia sp.]|nr:V-type ATP synthase subunit E family protein [Hespellia sp.]
MNGLDKMKDQILNEANSSATTMIAQAKEEAQAILDQAKEEAKAQGEKVLQKSKEAVAHQKERSQSSMELLRKQTILAAKQEVIAEVLEAAYQEMFGQDTGSYFAMLEKMITKYALGEVGRIAFSSEDQKRMPAGFEEKIQVAAKAKGGSLELEKEGRNIEGGFILIYGGIEENCTLRAMFHSAKDDLADQVHKLLFA